MMAWPRHVVVCWWFGLFVVVGAVRGCVFCVVAYIMVFSGLRVYCVITLNLVVCASVVDVWLLWVALFSASFVLVV